jgi:hypothetical protein
MANEEPRDADELKEQTGISTPASPDARELADDELESVSGGSGRADWSGPGDEGPEESVYKKYR